MLLIQQRLMQLQSSMLGSLCLFWGVLALTWSTVEPSTERAYGGRVLTCQVYSHMFNKYVCITVPQ